MKNGTVKRIVLFLDVSFFKKLFLSEFLNRAELVVLPPGRALFVQCEYSEK